MTQLDRTKLLAARFRAVADRPYYAAALYSLTVVECDQVPTMAVDRFWRCYVSPSFVERMPVEGLAGVWIHEVSHLLREHHARAKRLPAPNCHLPRRVNVAQDLEINDDLLSDGLSLPGGLSPEQFGLEPGLLFEQYLQLLPETFEPECWCGSGAHGVSMPWDLSNPSRGDGVNELEAESIRRQVARAMREHVRAQGRLAGGWQRWVDEVLEPQIDWRRVLGSAVRQAVAWSSGAADYSYARPARRARVVPGVVLPSLCRPLPRVAIVIDTSGSMDQDQLRAALAEVSGVLREVGIRENRVKVLSCDAIVHTTQKVTRVAEVQLEGGGGTNMAVGIEEALRERLPPQVIIVLTDGETPWPQIPPRARVIAGLIAPKKPRTPSWVEAIHIATNGTAHR